MIQAARRATGSAAGPAPAWEQAAYALGAWAYIAPFLWVAPFLAAPPLWIAAFAQVPERPESNRPSR